MAAVPGVVTAGLRPAFRAMDRVLAKRAAADRT
jgi:hypothetical protein